MIEQQPAGPAAVASRAVRYVVESDFGLYVGLSPELGEHLVVWTSRQAAEEASRGLENMYKFQVSEINVGELHDELEALQQDGMRFMMVDPSPEASGFPMPVEEALALYARLATDVPTEHRSDRDHFIQRLDRIRRAGAVPDRDAESIPFDCPACKTLISVPEADYRHWRDGTMEVFRCPTCKAHVHDALFGTVTCSKCGVESGPMPISLSRGIGQGEFPWYCLDCGDAALKAAAAAKPHSPINWYSWIVGTAAIIALLAGAFIKFVLMN